MYAAQVAAFGRSEKPTGIQIVSAAPQSTRYLLAQSDGEALWNRCQKPVSTPR